MSPEEQQAYDTGHLDTFDISRGIGIFMSPIFRDTPFAAEWSRLKAGTPWYILGTGGPSFYHYGELDECIGQIVPREGDVVNLVRRPENKYDPNAIEVWWRNRFHLGFLMREVAAALAPALDRGKACASYVYDAGTGERHTMHIVIIGEVALAVDAEVKKWPLVWNKERACYVRCPMRFCGRDSSCPPFVLNQVLWMLRGIHAI
jgi:hypothetical protein